jgi:hypothetical protein
MQPMDIAKQYKWQLVSLLGFVVGFVSLYLPWSTACNTSRSICVTRTLAGVGAGLMPLAMVLALVGIGAVAAHLYLAYQKKLTKSTARITSGVALVPNTLFVLFGLFFVSKMLEGVSVSIGMGIFVFLVGFIAAYVANVMLAREASKIA